MLSVTNDIIDLGKIKFGQPYDFKYTLTNKSDSAIQITNVIAGCSSCTTAKTNKNTLIKGEKTDVDVRFTPGSTGIQVKQVQVVHSINNIPQKPLVLKFKAQVYD